MEVAFPVCWVLSNVFVQNLLHHLYPAFDVLKLVYHLQVRLLWLGRPHLCRHSVVACLDVELEKVVEHIFVIRIDVLQSSEVNLEAGFLRWFGQTDSSKLVLFLLSLLNLRKQSICVIKSEFADLTNPFLVRTQTQLSFDDVEAQVVLKHHLFIGVVLDVMQNTLDHLDILVKYGIL